MINIKCSRKLNNLKEMYNDILREAINTFGITENIEINVQFVSRYRIRRINKMFRHVDKVTDVLSFPNLELNHSKDLCN